MTEDLRLSSIRSRISENLAVTYHWLQQEINIPPNETEGYLMKILREGNEACSKYIRCEIANIESTALISISPSSDYKVGLHEFGVGSYRSQLIPCDEAQFIPRTSDEFIQISSKVSTQMFKSEPAVTCNVAKSVKPPVPQIKAESKAKTSMPTKKPNQNIQDSMKFFGSQTTNNNNVIEVEKEKDVKLESNTEVKEPCEPKTTETEKDVIIECEPSKKRHRLFHNFDDAPIESSGKAKIKRRRLIIESDDDDDICDKVLVNDSMIEDDDHIVPCNSSLSESESIVEIKKKKETAKKTKKEIVTEKDTAKKIKKEIVTEKKVSVKENKKDTVKSKKDIKESKTINQEEVLKENKKDIFKEKRENPPSMPGRRKVMRQVERTFKDEDGFLVTDKVLEACFEEEEPEVRKKETPCAVLKKVVVATKDVKKNKQTNLMNFFQKL